MRRFSRRGSMLLEAAMMVPLLVLLLVGMVQIAKITYVYAALRKTVYSVASYLSTQQGTDFCNPTDQNIAQAISFGLTGTTDNSQPVFITGLTPEMVVIATQRYDSTTQTFTTGCDVGAPNYITVSINGYTIQPRIPLLPIDAIPLRPQVKVHYGGI